MRQEQRPEQPARRGFAARLARGVSGVAGAFVAGAGAYTIWEVKRAFLRHDIRQAVEDADVPRPGP